MRLLTHWWPDTAVRSLLAAKEASELAVLSPVKTEAFCH